MASDETEIPSRPAFVGLGGGFLAAAVVRSARTTIPFGSPGVVMPGEASAGTRYRTVDVGGHEIMLDLLYDIRNNRQTVADARQFFKARQRRVMIATGVNDPLFPGASMKPPSEMSGIEFHPIDSGHFALEDRYTEIGSLTRGFLKRVIAT